MVSGGGGDLQWGKVCNGFSVPLQIFRGEGLQYTTGQMIQLCRFAI